MADGDEDRFHRQRLMAEANSAYQAADVARLRAILEAWKGRPEVVDGTDIGAALVRVIRQIAQARTRLETIEQELGLLKTTELYRLKLCVDEAAARGEDLLASMANSVEQLITAARERLNTLNNL